MGLIQTGQFHEEEGLKTMGTIADMQQKRDFANKQIKQEKKQGILAAAGTGAAIGTEIMPGWGTLIGGAVGALGGYFL